MSPEAVKIPDLGGVDSANVIEVLVAVGDVVAAEDSLITLESEKASMDVPSPLAGTVAVIHVAEGDEVSEGVALVDIQPLAAPAPPATPAAADAALPATPAAGGEAPSAPSAAAPAAQAAPQPVAIPDLGGVDSANVIEVLVAVGDVVAAEDSLITLESEKASMDVPSPLAGTVAVIHVAEGDEVSEGVALVDIQPLAAPAPPATQAAAPSATPAAAPSAAPAAAPAAGGEAPSAPSATARPELAALSSMQPAAPRAPGIHYAGPAARKIAREFGIDLSRVQGSGNKGRVLKEDLQNFVKRALSGAQTAAVARGIPDMPDTDFAQFGEVALENMSGMHRATANNMARNWLNVPHVTQFDAVDYTALDDIRNALKPEMERRGIKLTPMAYLLKACALTLADHPEVNVSLHPDGKRIYRKSYVHIGVAVDTPAGLMVPVLRDVLDKDLWTLATEVSALAAKARERKLRPADMQGGCFTISSLGGIGGLGFTPIVNAPEAAILGVSRLAIQPVYVDGQFVPRKTLPLALSYDHRALNGATAGRFLTDLAERLSAAGEWTNPGGD